MKRKDRGSGSRDAGKENLWRQMISRQKDSGKTQKKFCKIHLENPEGRYMFNARRKYLKLTQKKCTATMPSMVLYIVAHKTLESNAVTLF